MQIQHALPRIQSFKVGRKTANGINHQPKILTECLLSLCYRVYATAHAQHHTPNPIQLPIMAPLISRIPSQNTFYLSRIFSNRPSVYWPDHLFSVHHHYAMSSYPVSISWLFKFLSPFPSLPYTSW